MANYGRYCFFYRNLYVNTYQQLFNYAGTDYVVIKTFNLMNEKKFSAQQEVKIRNSSSSSYETKHSKRQTDSNRFDNSIGKKTHNSIVASLFHFFNFTICSKDVNNSHWFFFRIGKKRTFILQVYLANNIYSFTTKMYVYSSET